MISDHLLRAIVWLIFCVVLIPTTAIIVLNILEAL